MEDDVGGVKQQADRQTQVVTVPQSMASSFSLVCSPAPVM